MLCTSAPSFAAEKIDLGFAGGNSCTGNYLDISAKEIPLQVSAFGLHLAPGRHNIQVYSKTNSYVGSETFANHWRLLSERAVVSTGQNKQTRIEVKQFTVNPHSTTGLLIRSDHTLMYSNADGSNQSSGNKDLSTYSGDASCGEAFVGVVADRVFNGVIYYNESDCYDSHTEQGKGFRFCL